MTQSTAKNANSRNMLPTSGCLVQKQAPEARRRIVGIIRHCNTAQYCTRNWMEQIL